MVLLDRDTALYRDCVAALEVCDADSVICGVTAARVHGLWVPEVGAEVHVAVATPGEQGRRMIRSRRCEVVAHRRQLRRDDRTWVAGIAVTSLAATWFDLAALLDVPALVAAGDSTLRNGSNATELVEVVRARVGHRGVRRARVALGMVDGRSRSRPESHLRAATMADDLPRFEVNVPVQRDEGGWLAEPDLSLAAAKIALEYQGEDHGTPQRLRRDLTRAFDLRREGWVVLSYGPAEVFGRPWQITAEVRREVRARRPDLLGRPAPRRHAPRRRVRPAA